MLPIFAVPFYPFFLLPDAPPTSQEKKVRDEAQRKKAAEVEQRLQKTKGAKRMILLSTRDDVSWFRQQAAAPR